MSSTANVIAVEPRADAAARDLSLLAEQTVAVNTEERDQALRIPMTREEMAARAWLAGD